MRPDDSQWPARLRRHTAVELLGPPRLFFAWLTIALSLMTIVYVGAWNAAKYPIVLGYDMQPNAAYAHILLDQHHIPSYEQSAESRQPPGYYFVAEIASRAGHEIFGWVEARPFTAQLPEASYRGAQILNVALVLGTALILLGIARIAAPQRPEVWAASLAFFAFLPVVSKTAAMFHPETLNMFLSTAAVFITARIALSRRLAPTAVAMLAVTLISGFLVRASTLFTLISVIVALAIAFGPSAIRAIRSRRSLTSGAIAVLALTVVGAAGLLLVTRAPDLRQGLTHFGGQTGSTAHSQFTRLDIESMFESPYRPHFLNEALPETYTEIWGDWIGAFAWAPFESTPSPPALSVLRDQMWIGILPTLFAIVGWGILGWRVRRRPELAAFVVLPFIAVIGYLVRSYQIVSIDGDLFKATYLLTTAPLWALAFGTAFAALKRWPRMRFGLGAALVVFAILELRFMLYGIQAGHPIF